MTAWEARLLNWTRKRFLWICCAAVLMIGLALRHAYYPLITNDLSYFYTLWIKSFEKMGLSAVSALGREYDYNMLFAYIFTFYGKVFGSGNVPLLIKLTNGILEILTDGVCLWMILSLLPKERRAMGTLIGLALLWLNPVMIWNAAAWGQTDVYYVLFSVISVFLLIRNRPGWALICLSVALSLKLQAIFLVPLFVMAWFNGEKRFSCLWFLTLPAAVLLSGVPMLFMGESLTSTLRIYLGQSARFNGLTLNKYNLYSLLDPMVLRISDATLEMFFRTGIALCAGTLGGMVVWMAARKAALSGRTLLLLAAWCVLCCGFLLPRMHERYALVGEVLLCCWAVCLNKPRGYAYVFAALLPTLGAYAYSLYDAAFLDAQVGGVISLALMGCLTWEVLREMRTQRPVMAAS